MTSALYSGAVTHRRLKPRRHFLRYRVMQGLFDLDELPVLDRRLRMFGHNRAAPFSFHDRDHGDGSGSLRTWAERQLGAAGLPGPWGEIRILCMPRLMGYVFNPLSVYFCHDAAGQLRGMIYEVNNTFGGRHAYVLPAEEDGSVVRQACPKTFYVSPFLPMDLTYQFRIAPPARSVVVDVAACDCDGPVLAARFSGEARPLTDRALFGALLSFPAMTLKVIAGIHWEALKLLLAGLRFSPGPTPGPNVDSLT